MRKIVTIAFICACLFSVAQPKNRYGMKVEKKDGKCSISRMDEISKIVDVSGLKDLCELYVYKPERIQESEYKNCKTLKFTYKEYANYSLDMEVDLPLNSSKPAPFVIYVHGGGWSSGSLESFKTYSTYLASNGVAGVRIAYSLKKQKGHFQQGLDEVEAAYKFIKNKAKELNLDMNNFGLAGGSAGTPLASYWAMKLPGCKLYMGYNGIYDLTSKRPKGSFPGNDNSYLSNYNDDESSKSISSLFMVPDKNPPSVLVAHGTGDVTISYLQSTALCDAVEKNGGKTKRLIYPYYQHAFYSIKSSDMYEDIVIETCKFAKLVFNVK